MKVFFIVVILFLHSSGIYAFLTGNFRSFENSQLSEKMKEKYVKYNSTAAVSYVSDVNHICSSGYAGFAQVQGRTPTFDGNGRIHMGSNTKSMTSTLVGILLENNKIRGQSQGWKTRMIEIFPEYATNTPYENVTLDSLAGHFSGFDANPPNPWGFDIPSQTLVQQRMNVTKAAFASAPINPPNTVFLYSNWGMIVLGHVVEVSLGISWEDALLKYFLGPLKMVDNLSDYPFGAPSEKNANWGHMVISDKMTHYPCDPNNPPQPPDSPTFKCDNPAYLGPAGTYSGNLLATSNYYRWLIQCSQGENTQSIIPLSQQGCLELLEPYGPTDPNNPSKGGYGHGWGIQDVPYGNSMVKMLSHAGSNTYNYVKVEVFPSLGKIYWAGTNSGYTTDQTMVNEILQDLKTYDFIVC